MSGLIMIGAFGLSLVGVGLLENAGVAVNHSALRFALECAKFGSILYILKLVSTLFL